MSESMKCRDPGLLFSEYNYDGYDEYDCPI